MPLSFHLRDKNPDVVKAWEFFFGRQPNMDIAEGDVLELDVSAVVSPINSFGIMSTGFALGLNHKAEGKLEGRLRKLIQDTHAGELAVGCAEVIKSGIASPKYVVVAPTVRVPPDRMNNASVNTYLATRAALRALAAVMRKEKQEGKQPSIESVAMVGMGTGSAKTPPAIAAFQMYEAYCQIVLGREPNFATIEAASAHDLELRKPRYL